MTARLTHQFSIYGRARTTVASLLASALLALAWTVVAPISTANAGEWAQATCSDGGEPASTEGWATGTVGGYLASAEPGDTCAQVGGSLSLNVRRARSHGERTHVVAHEDVLVFRKPDAATQTAGRKAA